MKTSLAALVIGGLVAGCASQSTQESSPAPAPAPTAMSGTPSARAAPAASVAGVPSAAKAMPQARSIYYEYDRSEIRADGVKVVDINTQYLREHPDLKVKVEGTADERRSRCYDRAVGQRRAHALMSRTTTLGIPSHRSGSVSYDKEKPKPTTHDESAWSENRRSDIVYR